MNYKETLSWLFSHLPMFQRVGDPAYKADLVNTKSCSLLWNAGGHGGLSGRVHAGSGRKHLAKYNFGDVAGINVGAAERRSDSGGAQCVGRQGGKAAVEGTYGGTGAGSYDDFCLVTHV